MGQHSLFNYSTQSEAVAPGGLTPAGSGGSGAKTTNSTFLTPQALAAFPLAAGLVAAFWQGAELLGAPAKNYWICFCIAIVIALINYFVSITDPKLKASSRDKGLAFVFALINGVYLFVTAVGIKVTLKP